MNKKYFYCAALLLIVSVCQGGRQSKKTNDQNWVYLPLGYVAISAKEYHRLHTEADQLEEQQRTTVAHPHNYPPGLRRRSANSRAAGKSTECK